MLTDERIREIYLSCGFTVKPGQTDLKPYVFESARAIEAEATAPLLARIAELELANEAFAKSQEWWNERMFEMEQRLSAAPAAQPEGWQEFIQKVATQKPEKPDYWSACGQCERNASEAEDLLPAAPAAQPMTDVVRKALDRAFVMGQNYWADADSESYSANKRSDVTRQKFNAMRDEVCAQLDGIKEQP